MLKWYHLPCSPLSQNDGCIRSLGTVIPGHRGGKDEQISTRSARALWLLPTFWGWEVRGCRGQLMDHLDLSGGTEEDLPRPWGVDRPPENLVRPHQCRTGHSRPMCAEIWAILLGFRKALIQLQHDGTSLNAHRACHWEHALGRCLHLNQKVRL